MELDKNVWLNLSERLDGLQRGAGLNPATLKSLYVFLISIPSIIFFVTVEKIYLVKKLEL